MAHFAQLNDNSIVIQVIVVHNNELGLPESEAKGIEFCQSLFGADTRWVQTSYNGNFRGKYAGVGDTYDVENDVFLPPVVEPVSVATPVVEPVVMVETTQDIPTLTSSNISALTSAHIAALTTDDLQTLTTTGL